MSRATRVSALLLFSAAAWTGCANGSSESAASADDDRVAYETVAQRFGEYILQGNWAAAYDMTTPSFQRAVAQARLQTEYSGLLRQIRQDDPNFRPNMVRADLGALPADETEAKDTYGMVAVPPRSTWKAWMAVGIGVGDHEGVERGIDAWVLIVEEAGQLKIGHVNFEFMD